MYDYKKFVNSSIIFRKDYCTVWIENSQWRGQYYCNDNMEYQMGQNLYHRKWIMSYLDYALNNMLIRNQRPPYFQEIYRFIIAEYHVEFPEAHNSNLMVIRDYGALAINDFTYFIHYFGCEVFSVIIGKDHYYAILKVR